MAKNTIQKNTARKNTASQRSAPAEEHGEEQRAVHEVGVKALCAVRIVFLPQLRLAQHLRQKKYR